MQSLDSTDLIARLESIERLLMGFCTSPWLTTQEAASYLKCSIRQIERLTRRGLLPFHRQDPTSKRSPRLYHRKHITAFLVTGKNPAQHRLSATEKQLVEDLL